MNDQNEGWEELDTTAPEADIPNLKRKEKERKRGGGIWGQGGAGADAFTGAIGGNGAQAAGMGAARSAVSAASSRLSQSGAAAAAEGLLGTAPQGTSFAFPWFSQLASTWLGKVAIGAVAALLLGGGWFLAVRMFGSEEPATTVPQLGGLNSTIQVDRQTDAAGLHYAAQSSKGELKFDDPSAAGPVPEPKSRMEDKVPSPGPQMTSDNSYRRDRLEHNLSGAKLSSSLGGQFGSKNVFSNPDAPKFGAMAQKGNLSSFSQGLSQLGKGGRLARSITRASRAFGLGRWGPKSSRALAQLRGQQTLVSPMRSATNATEAQSAAATQQFEGSHVVGAAQPSFPAGIDRAVPVSPPGGLGSAPQADNIARGDISQVCSEAQINAGMISDGQGCVLDLNRRDISVRSGLVSRANGLLAVGAALLATASLLVITGRPLLSNPFTAPAGAAMLAAAGMIAAMISGVMGAMVIMIGRSIAQLGGGPQGAIFVAAGSALIAGAGLALSGIPHAGIIGMIGAAIAGVVAAVGGFSG